MPAAPAAPVTDPPAAAAAAPVELDDVDEDVPELLLVTAAADDAVDAEDD